jgi:hypothetical protein
VKGRLDEVLGVPSHFSLGFLRPGPTVFFGSTPRAFGSPGAGGSFAFADPDARLGYAYVMNKLDFYLENDPREKALRDALYRAIGRVGVKNRVPGACRWRLQLRTDSRSPRRHGYDDFCSACGRRFTTTPPYAVPSGGRLGVRRTCGQIWP